MKGYSGKERTKDTQWKKLQETKHEGENENQTKWKKKGMTSRENKVKEPTQGEIGKETKKGTPRLRENVDHMQQSCCDQEEEKKKMKNKKLRFLTKKMLR